jgi:hypothetical protein
MEDLLKKISSYNVVNHLVPGAIYTFAISSYLGRTDIVENLVLFFFFAYFSGVVIGRVGSLLVEKTLRIFWKKGSYEDFLDAEKEDLKLQILVEDQNMFRSLIALAITLYASVRYLELRQNVAVLQKYDMELGTGIFIFLFIIAYISHDQFITKRINRYKSREKN